MSAAKANHALRFLGIISLIFLIFGQICRILIESPEFSYYIGDIHLYLGGVLLILFVLGGGLRALQAQVVKKALRYGGGMLLYSSIFVGLLAAVNYASFKNQIFRYDSTKEKVYTLSPQSTQALQDLSTKVVARAFFINKMDAQAQVVLEMFAQSSPKFRWEWIDPEKYPASMERYGISQPGTIHLSYEGNAELKGEVKVTAAGSKRLSEQDITNGILKLGRSGERIICYFVGHGEADIDAGGEKGYLYLKEAIQGENLIVRKLSFSDEAQIPSDCLSLLIMAPRKALLSNEVLAIEKYLKSGGTALMFAEPRVSEFVGSLVKPLGIVVGMDHVLDKVVLPADSLTQALMVTKYGAHPITNGFTQGTLFSGAVSVRASENRPEQSVLTELVLTGPNSWAETNLQQLYSDKPTASRDQEDLRGPVPIVTVFEGAYPEGKFQRESEKDSSAPKQVSGKLSRVVVFGDVDFISNLHIRELYNADFFLNVLNWVIGEDKGITIRPRNLKSSIRQILPDELMRIILLSTILLPELLLISGLAAWWFRKRA